MNTWVNRWTSRWTVGCAVWAAALGVLLLAGGPAAAEPMVSPGDKTKASQIRLAERGSEPGTWGRAQARLRGDTEVRYFVRGLDVAAPLSVQVIAERLDAPVRVSLHRHAWAQAQDSGSTGASGIYRFDGRAHGDVGVKLVSETGEPVRATVLFWQGKPVPRSLAAVYAAPGTPRAAEAGMGGGGSTGPASGAGWLPWLGGALGALVLVGVGVALGRRGRGGAASAVVVLGVALAMAAGGPGPLHAQDKDKPPNPFEGTEGWKPPPAGPTSTAPKDKDKDAAPKDAAAPKPPAQAEAPNPFEGTEGWKPPANTADLPKDPKEPEAPKEPASASSGSAPASQEAGAAPEPEPEAGSYRDRIEAAEAHARELATQVANNRAEIERLRLLLESDRDAEPDPAQFPPLPLSCRPPTIEGDGIQRSSEAEAAWAHFERCQQCYAQPLADFEQQLLLYERLRVLYTGTRDYVTFAIDLGDKLPKPHSVLENAWAAQKLLIRRSFDGTKKAYDAKLIEFNDRLSEILDRIGTCEADLNNNPMWRQTTGLFFHNTMGFSYKRTD